MPPKTVLVLAAVVLAVIAAVGPASPAHAATDRFTIAYGDTISDGVPGVGAGNLEAGGDTDAYTFDGSADDVVIVESLAGYAGTFRMTLTAPDGTPLVDEGLYVTRELTLPTSGTYELTISGGTPTDVGPYSFALWVTPPAEVFAIASGDTVGPGVPGPGAGEVETPGSVDVYELDGEAGETIVVDRLTGQTTEVRWRLEAPDGSVVFDSFLVDQSAQLPTTGRFRLIVEGTGIATTGTYSFTLTTALLVADEFAIAVGDTVSDGVPGPGAGSIETAGSVDRYTFTGTAGQTVDLDVLSGSTNEVRPHLAAPDGSTVLSGFWVDERVVLPASGTYVLTVFGTFVTSTGTYSFTLVGATPTGTVTIATGPVEGAGVYAYAPTDGLIPSGGATTGVDGSYDLSGLAPGSYRLVVVPPVGSDLEVTWIGGVGRGGARDVSLPDDTGVDVVLEGAAPLAGTIDDLDGNPLVGVAVWAFAPHDTWVPTAIAVTAADGTYHLPTLPAGSYDVAFGPPAGSGLRVEWAGGGPTRSTAVPVTVSRSTTTVLDQTMGAADAS